MADAVKHCKYFDCEHERYEVCDLTDERCDWVGLCMCLDNLCDACTNKETCEIKED